MYKIKTELSSKEFWDVYLKVKPNDFTETERGIIAEHWVGEPKQLRGKYKAYVTGLKDRISLDKQMLPKEVSIQINITINDVSE